MATNIFWQRKLLLKILLPLFSCNEICLQVFSSDKYLIVVKDIVIVALFLVLSLATPMWRSHGLIMGNIKCINTIYDTCSNLDILGGMTVSFNSRATNHFANDLANMGSSLIGDFVE